METARKPLEFVSNAADRLVPIDVPGLGRFAPYGGADGWVGADVPRVLPLARRAPAPGGSKVTDDLRKAIERSGLQNGMTISFHHHLRDGDGVVDMVLTALGEMGFRGLTLAPSSLTESQKSVVGAIRAGVVTRLCTSGLRGELGRLVSAGEMDVPVLIRSHGGRARAVETGQMPIDVAFLAAPACDDRGNATGCLGPSACGSLGYAITDARHARHVVAVTDHLMDYPLRPHISIPEYLVDQVLVVPSIGDPSRIASGALRITRNPLDLQIARNAFGLIVASGLLKDDCSFQVGAGGASLAVAACVKDYMKERGVVGAFGLGGTSGFVVDMMKEGCFRALLDVQSFDAAVTSSMLENPNHMEIDASWYANPFNRGCAAHNLDVVVLAALEADVDFNVNVQTGHDGVLRGAVGGHPDTAAGATLSVVVMPSFRGGVPSIKAKVTTICTPGETVDAIVTERGLCVNPRRPELAERARKAGLPLREIADLKASVERLTGVPDQVDFDRTRPVALVEYRDGTLLDTVWKVQP